MQKRFTTLFFDLDGTLTDSREGILNCLRYAVDQLGLEPFPEESLFQYIGPPLQDIFRQIVGDGFDELAVKGAEFYRERFGEKGWRENRLYPGIPKMLEKLRDVGFRLYVVTTKPTIYAKQIVAHFSLNDYFLGVYGPELDGTRKDKADLIQYVLEKENIQAEEVLMIGDRSHDVLGAKAHGIPCAGVLWGFGSQEELEEAGVWRLCGTPDVLVEMVSGE